MFKVTSETQPFLTAAMICWHFGQGSNGSKDGEEDEGDGDKTFANYQMQ